MLESILSSHKNERGYVSGAYGDRSIRSFNSPIEYQNEWEIIPEKQKKELVDWLNKADLNTHLHDQSLIAQASNPVVEYLVREKVLGPIAGIDELKSNQDMPEHHDINDHDTAQPFIDAFMHHKQNSRITLIFQPKRTRIGFVVNDYKEIHFIHFATLHPIWYPQKSQATLAKIAEEKMKSSPEKNDENLGKIFRTTNNHSFGPGWCGILKLNISKLSTMVNGSQHALKLPRPRYMIEWVNITTPRNRTEISYKSSEISEMIKNNEVEKTDGFDKAPRIYPETWQLK